MSKVTDILRFYLLHLCNKINIASSYNQKLFDYAKLLLGRESPVCEVTGPNFRVMRGLPVIKCNHKHCFYALSKK